MSASEPILELESISGLPERHRQSVPDEDTRLTRRIGDSVRLLVLVNGQRHQPIWVRITHVERPCYRGVFEAVEDSGQIRVGTQFEFTAQNIIEY